MYTNNFLFFFLQVFDTKFLMRAHEERPCPHAQVFCNRCGEKLKASELKVLPLFKIYLLIYYLEHIIQMS